MVQCVLTDTFNTFGLILMVDTPTRDNNILATYRPGLIQKVKVTPGLSDHKVITIVSSLATTIIESRPQSRLLWHQVDLQPLMKESNFLSKFIYGSDHYPKSRSVGYFLKMNASDAWTRYLLNYISIPPLCPPGLPVALNVFAIKRNGY